jgi:hypothetical protein
MKKLFYCFDCKTPEASSFEPSSREHTLLDYLKPTGIPQLEPGDSREVLEDKVGQVLKTHWIFLSKDIPPNSHTWKELGQEVVNRIGEGVEPSFVYDTLMDPNSLHFVDYLSVATKICIEWTGS